MAKTTAADKNEPQKIYNGDLLTEEEKNKPGISYSYDRAKITHDRPGEKALKDTEADTSGQVEEPKN